MFSNMWCLSSKLLLKATSIIITLLLTTIYEVLLILKLSYTFNQHDFRIYAPVEDSLGICTFTDPFPDMFQEANYLTPVSFALILIYCVTEKRRSYLIKSKNRFVNLLNYISLPKIQNVFSKKRRLYYCLGFSIISFHVITSTIHSILERSKLIEIDPEDVLREIANELSDVLFIGCRYIPVFMALESRNLINRCIVGVYLLLELCFSWYQQAVCLITIKLVVTEDTDHAHEVSLVSLGLINLLHSLFTSYMIVFLTFGSWLERRLSKQRSTKVLSIEMSYYDCLIQLSQNDDVFICSNDLKYTKFV